MSAAKKDIGARVDALSQALEGTEFVAAVERLAEEDPDEKLLLQEVLVERAADEEDLQEAVRRRYAERGWTRRMLSRLEGVCEPAVRDAAAAALIGLGPDASRLVLPDLRRRLHSSSVAERIGAMESLAAAGDATALAVFEECAAAGETPDEREAARSAAVILHADKV